MTPSLAMRGATPDDYERFVTFFAELGVEDPVPTREAWSASMMPRTAFLERDGDAIGYAMIDVLARTGYVRHIVVAPNARRGGVGRALMERIAAELRSRGCTRWCLNVKEDNVAARTLYERVGMKRAYESVAFEFPWAAAAALPHPTIDLDASVPTPGDDGEVEARFDLPSGMLAGFRATPGQLLFVLRERVSGALAGFSRFAPAFPGTFPFRVARPEFASSLLDALRPHARPEDDRLMLTVEDDAPLARTIAAAGGRVTMRLVHLRGDLPQ